MKGCRPLTDQEIAAVLEQINRTQQPLRNAALFQLGIRTGFRISELLSLRLADVWQNGRLADEIAVARRHMKKKREGRSVPLHNPEARAALEAWIAALAAAGHTAPDTALFRSREGANQPMNRRSAWEMLKRAYTASGLTGKLATHTLRKTFAKQMKELLGDDLLALKEAMGHAQITSTTAYVQFDQRKLTDAFRKL